MADLLLIAGSRSLRPTVGHLDSLVTSVPARVICGCAPGVDRCGYDWARARGVEVEFFPGWEDQRDWALEHARPGEVVHACPDTDWKTAGVARNAAMSEITSRAEIFWDGISSGTKSMLDLCKRRGIPYHLEEPPLRPGDIVRAHSCRTSRTVKAIGVQDGLFGDSETVALFDDGSFLPVSRLKRVSPRHA